MFDFKRAYRSALAAHPDDPIVDLSTPWGETLDAAQVLQEYPRPTMRRASYSNLNGLWDYAIVPAGEDLEHAAPPLAYEGEILVPFSPEAPLSGVKRQLQPNELLWYRRTFSVADAGLFAQGSAAPKRLLLHFEAVDHAMACFVNGRLAGSHVGGYLPFSFDITDCLEMGENELAVCVADPSDTGFQPRGKQKIARGTIWYTAQSGIWQTVWMEVVPAVRIESLRVYADPDSESVLIDVDVSAGDRELAVDVSDGTNLIIRAEGLIGADSHEAALRADVFGPHLWSPDDPFLYMLTVTYGEDRISSYCAFRTFSVEADAAGVKRFCLNHKPLFLRGLLDQGYWSDGLLTAPSDDALVFDIRTAKNLGFNMLRKHIKVESDRWYYHCDRLGMIVWQDMVSGGGVYPDFSVSRFPTLFPGLARHVDDTKKYGRFGADDADYRRSWVEHGVATVEHLRNHPAIATWVIFNEGWGQFDAAQVEERFREADPTRPLDQTSGWFDQGGGDYSSVHNYFRPLTVPRGMRTRAAVISEFGGLALHVADHSAIARAYGYETFESAEQLQAALDRLIAQADGLEAKGLSGYVYTQLSDVEEEVNGLVTFDRRVVKVRPVAPASGVE